MAVASVGFAELIMRVLDVTEKGGTALVCERGGEGEGERAGVEREGEGCGV